MSVQRGVNGRAGAPRARVARRPAPPPPPATVLLAWLRAAVLSPEAADGPLPRGGALLRALDRRLLTGLALTAAGLWLLVVVLTAERGAPAAPAEGLVRVDRVADAAAVRG